MTMSAEDTISNGGNTIVETTLPEEDEDDHESAGIGMSWFRRAKRAAWIVVASIVIFVCLIVIFSVKPGILSNKLSPAAPPTTIEDSVDRRRYVLFRSALARMSEPATLVNPLSPQSLALNWLVYEDKTLTFPDGQQRLDFNNITDEDFHRRLEQRYALMVLAFSTNGAGWRGIPPWEEQTTVNECDPQYLGVSCEGDTGIVSRIDLVSRKLSGTLPEEIGLLTKLSYLDLSENRLEGRIPLAFRRLTDLVEMSLSHNDFVFTVSSSIEHLTKLQSLELSDTYLEGPLSTTIASMVNLTRLVITNSQLSGPLFRYVQNLTNLEVLSAENTEISGDIPSELSQLSKLGRVSIQATNIRGSIPSEIGKLTNLEEFLLGGEYLTGTIPDTVGYLTKLQELVLTPGLHMWGTLPSTIGELSQLTYLAIIHTSIGGTLPSELALLQHLVQLDFSTNSFSGAFPAELTSIASLTSLHINSNSYMTGTIPQAFCDKPNMIIWLDCLGGFVCENNCCPDSWCYF